LSAERFDPPLTCTFSPLENSWRPLADTLAGAVDGRPVDELQRFGEISLIERASVAILEVEETSESENAGD
jgi:LacI family transcriptional regulator